MHCWEGTRLQNAARMAVEPVSDLLSFLHGEQSGRSKAAKQTSLDCLQCDTLHPHPRMMLAPEERLAGTGPCVHLS